MKTFTQSGGVAAVCRPLVKALLGLVLALHSASLMAQNPQMIIPRPPEIAASSYILLDALTGQVIVEKNADEPLPPASLTKIMTAYIAEVEIANGNMSLTDEAHVLLYADLATAGNTDAARFLAPVLQGEQAEFAQPGDV